MISSVFMKPNLLFILTDQQRWDTIHSLNAPWMSTPNLDGLRTRGIAFENAYCPGATCVASRAAIFTGMYAHNTGAWSFQDWAHHRNIVHDLADGGYWCASIGKMHFMPRDAAGGFHERLVVENPSGTTNWGGNGDDAWGKYLAFHGRRRENNRQKTDPDWLKKFQCAPWQDEEHLHSDAFVANSARAWLRNHHDTGGAEPWFLEVGFPGPHEPWDPPQRWVDHYVQSDNLPTPIGWDDDLSEKPPQQKAHQQFFANCEAESRINMPEATLKDVRRMRAHNYAKISYLDELIGNVLGEAEDLGMLENTWIVFSSDHGDQLGDRRLPYKWLMYENVVRVPLLIVPPPGKTVPSETKDLVSLIDLAPTFLELAGLPISTRYEGRSLKPYLEGKRPESPRQAVFCEDNTQIMMRRADGMKLVHYLDGTPGELYDLNTDPEERHNHWADSEKRIPLEHELLQWLARRVYANAATRCNPGNETHFPGWRWAPTGGPELLGPGLQSYIPIPEA